jgi:hypothetical protein
MGHHQHTPGVEGHADDWHRHSAAEGLPQREHASVINTRLLLGWSAAIVVGFGIIVVAVVVYFGDYSRRLKQDRVERMGYEGIAAEYWRTKSAAENALGLTDSFTFQWVDATAGTVAIPLSAAKENVIERYGSRPAPK